MWQGQSVSVVASTYRDRETIRGVVDGLFATGVVDEVVIVDNNAEDGTHEALDGSGARVVDEPRQGLGFGFHTALCSATGDLVITLEVDGTYAPRDILKLLVYSEDFDVVGGTRTSRLLIGDGAQMDGVTRWSNVLYAKAVEVLFNGPHLSDVGCIFRLWSRAAVDHVRSLPLDGGWAYNLDLLLYILRSDLALIEVPVNFKERGGRAVGAGQSMRTAARIAVRMLGIIGRHLVRSSRRTPNVNP